MKKLSLLVAVAMLLMLFTSCAKQEVISTTTPEPPAAVVTQTEQPTAEEESPAEEIDLSKMKVVILLPGAITDGGWNSIGYSCVTYLQEKYGMQTAYVENIAVSDMEEYLRMYANDEYDLVIVHGSQYIDNMKNVARSFPNINFCVSYGDEDISEGMANVGCAGIKNMGVMVGAIMGILTDANHVCFLGGEENPVISGFVNGIEPGVKLTNPDCIVDTGYIGTLTDQSLAKEVSLGYIDAGVDVISGAANAAQIGILEAAQEKGIYAVGTNADQYNLAPDAVVISVLRNYPAIYENLVLEIANGTFSGGLKAYGLAGGGTKVSEWHGWDGKLPADKVARINQVIADLFAGALGDY